MDDITKIISQFTFIDLLLIASVGFIILITIFSLIRYLKFEEKWPLLFRHLAGFIVGLIDQTFMVIFNFQPTFLAVVVLFDYAAYTLWFMFMPNFKNHENQRLIIIIWIIISTAVNTIFEHTALILLTGTLPYPTEPIVWTSVHTVVFYFGMHTIGALMVLYRYNLTEK